MKVLFATDGSPSALHALRAGMRMLPLTHAEIHVVAVANPMGELPNYEGLAAGGLLIADKLEQAALVDLKAAQAILQEAGLTASVEELQGDPAASILDSAGRFEADLIVMGSHGRGALARLFSGSVCDQVSHQWPGAVLIIRPEAGTL